jgi:outer membrane receptor protein involved in Fe transport
MKKSVFALFIFFIGLCMHSHAQNNILKGKVSREDKNILPGANIVVIGTNSGTNSNERGEFMLTQLPEGEITVQASFVGYKTLIAKILIKEGVNYHDFEFEKQEIKLDNITVTSQKREQQIIDVPITMSVIDANFMESNNITELNKLSQFVPGLLIRMQGADRPTFVIRGLSSDEVSPSAQPRVSVFYNNVPISRISGAAVELFDMQQVDVLKGPQESLFGRNAQIGAIHFISNKPTNVFGGYMAAGLGTLARKEFKGALNIPVVKDKLLLRASGVYDYRDGYIKNTFGGLLNGKNTVAGRLSLRYQPSEKTRADIIVNYQKDDDPGLGFMSMVYPNAEGDKNPFEYTTSLEQGKNLATGKDIFDATLNARHFFSTNNYLTVISSLRKINAHSRWDGDGTAAPAIDMSEDAGARQFYQEVRLNFSLKNRLTGSAGISYWNEHASQDYWFSPNDQHIFHLFFNTGFLVTPAGLPFPVTNLPNDPRLGPLAGMPLGTNHQETNYSNAINQAFESFLDASYQLSDKLSITGGIRLINEWFELSNEAKMTGGQPSVLGMLSGNYPNLFFRIYDKKTITETGLALTGRAGLKFAFNENTNLFAGYSKGRRPKVLQFTSAGEAQVLDPETVNSFEFGLKSALQQQLWFDIGLFYHDYLNFQTTAWVADANTGEFNYIVKDAGKASAYGAESNIRYAVLKGLQIYGNYAYIHSRFADKDTEGEDQAYAGNRFRLTPDHSFAIGLNGKVDVARNLRFFATPSYSYNSKIFFEDANSGGLEQGAYGLINFIGGLELPAQKVTLSFWADNLLNEEFIVSAGNTGSLFGAPTLIPGQPRMLGTKVTWKF